MLPAICGIIVVICAGVLFWPLGAVMSYRLETPKSVRRLLVIGRYLSAGIKQRLFYAAFCALMPTITFACIHFASAYSAGTAQLWSAQTLLLKALALVLFMAVMTLLFLCYTVPMHLRVYKAQLEWMQNNIKGDDES